MSGAYGEVSRFSIAKPHFFKGCDLKDCLVTDDPKRSPFAGTKVVATIGPSCQSVEVLCDMLRAGMVGVRLDLAKGTMQFHQQSLENLHKAMQITRRLCCILVDTQGRKVMVRKKERIDDSGWSEYDETYSITAGQTVTITTRRDVEPSASLMPVDFERFAEVCRVGDVVNVGRYMLFGCHLTLRVERVEGPDVVCVATNDAVLGGLLAMHIEGDGTHNPLVGGAGGVGAGLGQCQPPLLNDADRQCLQVLTKDHDIDFIALGYTRDGQDIREARTYLNSIGMSSTKIIAKIATRQSLYSFEGILDKADGIIISRGPLGMDCAPEKMALIQKTLIKACNLVGKPVLCSRVVDTMSDTPRPTRAEATDVANAVLDGVDGFLLGSETIKGMYPVETVRTVVSISRAAEKVFDHHFHYEHLMEVAVEGVKEGDAELAGDSDGESEAGDGMSTGGAATPAPVPAAKEVHGMLPSGAAPKRSSSHLKPQGEVLPPKAPSGRHVGFPDAPPAHGAADSSAASHAASDREKLRKVKSVLSNVKLASAAQAMAWYGLDSANNPSSQNPRELFKLEALASSAVRTADSIKASLIVVYTSSGQTAQLVAKYRPPMPILTLVVPNLLSDNIHWKLDGRSAARQCLLSRGVLPMLSAPGHSEDVMLQEAVKMAATLGLVKPHDFVVCVQRIGSQYCVKVLSVDEHGRGLESLPRRRCTTFQALPGVLSRPGAPTPHGTSESLVKTDSYFPEEAMGMGSLSRMNLVRPTQGEVERLASLGEDVLLDNTDSGGLVKTLSMLPNRL